MGFKSSDHKHNAEHDRIKAELLELAADVDAVQSTLDGAVSVDDALMASVAADTGSAFAGELSATYASRSAVARVPVHAQPAQPPKTMISTFQSGHGWTATGPGAGTDMNDTTDVGLGSQSAKFVTLTTGASGTVVSPVLAANDMTGKDFKILLKVEGLANLVDLRFYAGDSTFANAKNINLIPVEVGGSDFNYIKDSEWTWYTCTWDAGSNIGVPVRSAITKYQFRAQALNGASVILHVGAVASIPEQSILPYGVVSCTYDDGRATGLNFGRRALDKWGWAGTGFPIADKIATATGGAYVTLAQLRAAREQSGWEIACHAGLVVHHDAGFTTLTPAEVENDLLMERQWMYDNGLGLGEGFAWPRGMSNRAVENAAAKVVAYGRGNYTTQARETFPPANPMRIRAYNVGPTTTLATLQSWVDQTAVQNRGWLVLTFHEIVASGAVASLESNQSVHDGIIDYIGGLTNRPAVLPMIEALRKLG